MNKIKKKERGITIISLIGYVVLTIMVLAILTVLTANFRTNFNDLNVQTSYDIEFDKLNLQILKEIKEEGNLIEKEQTTETKLVFSNGNSYTYNEEDKTIYLNNNITIARNVEKNSFEINTNEDGKEILEVVVKIQDKQRILEYVMEECIHSYANGICTKCGYIQMDGTWNEEKGVNSPKLAEDMVAVYWATDSTGATVAYSGETAVEIYSKIDGSGNPSATGTDNANFNWNLWYDYVKQTGTTDGTSRWANAVTEDGSYWVWIPRYEYKITAAPSTTASTTNAGTIAINFVEKDDITATTGYTIHPAFINDSSNNYANGGWNSNLSGIWVAKYEMSMETSNDGTTWSTANPTAASGATVNGNIAIGTTVRMVSKPNVNSWRYINIANMYENSYDYDREKESHLMKNSEWGAVAYLTHSPCGRNGNEIYINNSSTYITGISGGSISASSSGTTYAYNTTNGVKASSTGNLTGIYDLSGGSWEYVAAFNSSYSGSYYTDTSYLNTKGSHFASNGGSSTKYATAYSNSTSTSYGDFTVGIVSIPGDAIEEVWVSGTRGWFNDYSSFVYSSNPFFDRGGFCSNGGDAGVFYAYYYNGIAESNKSFRIVCAF